jgi:hypothetical protein
MIAVPRHGMDLQRRDFLSGTAFALEKHWYIRRGNLGNQFLDRLDFWANPGNVDTLVYRSRFVRIRFSSCV